MKHSNKVAPAAHTHIVTVGRAQANASSRNSAKARANKVAPNPGNGTMKMKFLNDGGASQTCVPSTSFVTNAKPLDATHTRADAQLQISRATHEGDLAILVMKKKSALLEFAKVWVVPSCPEPMLAQRLVRQLGLRHAGPPGNGPGFCQDDDNNNVPLSSDQFGLEELQTNVTTTETKADSMHPQNSAALHNAIVCQR